MSNKANIHIPTDEEDLAIQSGIDADPDAFEITPEMMASNQFTVVDKRKGRGKQKSPTKIQKTVRFDQPVLDYLRADEKGWQQRLDKALKLVMSEHPEGVR